MVCRAMGNYWFNYGGITRDVALIETGNTYIEDYTIQLKKGSLKTVLGPGAIEWKATRAKH